MEKDTISIFKLRRWTKILNLAYIDYQELTGYTPVAGENIDIRVVDCSSKSDGVCVAWAWAYVYGDALIEWNSNYVNDELQRIEKNDDWSFGILHEISHDFDKKNWSFDAELMANFKMAYFLEKRNGRIIQKNKYYIGKEVRNYYKIADHGYDYAIKEKKYTNDFLTYIFLKINDDIGGWDIYKQVFRAMSDKSINSSNSVKFENFLIELENKSSKNVKEMFSDEEKIIISSKFGNVF
jgi:hypothetical protein